MKEKLLRLKNLVFTQKTDFLSLFEEVSLRLHHIASLFKDLIYTAPISEKVDLLKKISIIEEENDSQTHFILAELANNFITPFDREDIHAITLALEDIIDALYNCSKDIINLKVDTNDNGIHQLSGVILFTTIEIKNVIMLIKVRYARSNLYKKSFTSIIESIVRIADLKHQAEEIYYLSVDGIFKTDCDSKDIVKKMEIYGSMFDVLNKAAEIKNIFQRLIKYQTATRII
ncbi:MAG: DUF47 family protein [Phycisphaerales bacterium]|nr:DUF47 family protein [Phycisphaerales bacterium]